MPPGGPTFDSLDLKLMHHFCTSTAATLSRSSKAQEVWRDVVPDYAYTHHMLMHCILTLSAVHYGHVHKSSCDAVTLHDYRTRALYHHQLGLQLFRQRMETPDEYQTHEQLILCASLLCMLNFADVPAKQQTMTFEDALKFIVVMRGNQALWRAGCGLSDSSVLAPAFFDPPAPEHQTDFSNIALALSQLSDTVQDEVCKNAIAVLKGVAERQPNSEFRMLGTWPAGVSEEFLHLLKLRDDSALQTFEHYCTILESMRGLWWIDDYGQKLRAAIRGALSLSGTPDAAKPIGEL